MQSLGAVIRAFIFDSLQTNAKQKLSIGEIVSPTNVIPDADGGGALESKLQSKLNQAWIVDGLRNNAEVRGIHVLPRSKELGMVEEVEKLCAKLELGAIARQLEVIDRGEVGIHEARSVKRSSVGITELSGSWIGETARVEESINRRGAEPTITRLVWAIDVAGEVYAGSISAGH